MTWQQQLITILVVILGTVATRFTPYLVFSENRPIPPDTARRQVSRQSAGACGVRAADCLLPEECECHQWLTRFARTHLLAGRHGIIRVET